MKPRCIAPVSTVTTRYGEMPAYTEGLHDLGSDVYAWMAPNGSWGEANAGLVIGDDASLLVDTLWDVPKTQVMLDAMQPLLEPSPLVTVVNTHADGDHFWGNQLVADTDIVTSERARAEMAHHKPGSLLAFEKLGRVLKLLPGRKNRAAGHYFQAMCAPYEFSTVTHTPARRGFSGELNLDIGGRLVRLIEVGPAHTQGDLIVHVPDSKILFAADILFIGSTPVMWAGPVENWLEALDLILGMDAKIIVPGHGPLTDKEGVKAVKAYWQFANAKARQRFDAGTPPERAAHEIAASAAFRAQPFSNWDSPERLMTNVHLLYRGFAGETRPPGIPAKIALMRKQASLAQYFRDASPAAMRQD